MHASRPRACRHVRDERTSLDSSGYCMVCWCTLNMTWPPGAQVGSVPVYANLTLGGILSTSAHGSGYNTVATTVSQDMQA